MPRRNRSHRSERPGSDGGGNWYSLESREEGPDGDWIVRPVSGAAAGKVYRCPGCDHEIPVGVAHVVAWRADDIGAVDNRRHWHRACWNNRGNRRLSRRPGR
ncbi:ATP/GTP-binding protein [Yinghuangia sp. ASG 101]|uniref:ATP/GTP-binding protein n=1 Tax=Yinghuangia sp. ASG 101 TaxID=2896848 RepID=UPI001E2DD724|nr:ATP/GTP-binding protein [Yinghuangia sp. ASG 101]UGQ14233.1 ATP/GTP-binding protein [Yinghuangia sp. ASG 101]